MRLQLLALSPSTFRERRMIRMRCNPIRSKIILKSLLPPCHENPKFNFTLGINLFETTPPV